MAQEEKIWHYASAGQRFGPFTGSELRQLGQSGKLIATDLIWKAGMPNWVLAGSAKGLIPAPAAASVAPPPLPAAPKAQEQPASTNPIEAVGGNQADKATAAKFNKVLLGIYIAGAVATVVRLGTPFFVIATPCISYVLYKLSGALGMEHKKQVIFAVFGLIPMVNFFTAIYLNIKAAKFVKSG